MERTFKPANGYVALFCSFIFIGAGVFLFIKAGNTNLLGYVVPAVLTFILGSLMLKGLIIVEPNNTRVLTLFGKYIGSVKDNGLFFINHFM